MDRQNSGPKNLYFEYSIWRSNKFETLSVSCEAVLWNRNSFDIFIDYIIFDCKFDYISFDYIIYDCIFVYIICDWTFDYIICDYLIDFITCEFMIVYDAGTYL